jgi:hypothetical protein
MIDAIEKMMKNLPPVRGKNAGVACIVGFIFGGIGLAIYFRNVVDLFFPVGVGIALVLVTGINLGWLVGAIVVALYGYYRVHFSEVAAEQPR